MRATPQSGSEGRTWEARRQQAEQLFASGERQSAVARQLGVSRQCVHNWFWQWQGRRPTGERRPGGRRSRLTPQQRAALDAALRRGPRAFGFHSRRWTVRHITTLIERLTGFRYHPSSVWRILRAMGWTPRRPAPDPTARGYTPRQWQGPAVADGGGEPRRGS